MTDDYTFDNGAKPVKPAQPQEPWIPEHLPCHTPS